MKPLSTILIEDEPNIRASIRMMIRDDFSDCIEVVAETDEVPEALRLIRDLQPDLVLMDVEIRKGTAFHILESLPKVDFLIVFLTAHGKYAEDAFDVASVDYLLKPVQQNRFRRAINRALERFHSIQEASTVPRYALRSLGNIELIPHEEIVRLEGDGTCTHFHLRTRGKRTESRNLGKIVQDLWHHGNFLRVHQSHLINGRHLERVCSNEKTVRMSNGDQVTVSKRYWTDLKRWLEFM